MKAKRRQELKTNELVQTLMQAREFLERYGTYAVGGVVVVVVVLAGSMWYRRSLTDAQRREWEDYYAVRRAGQQYFSNPEGAEFTMLLARHRELAASARIPSLRLRALEELGAFCWRYATASDGAEGESVEQALNEAQAAFEQIVAEYPSDARATGNGLLALGAIAVERGDFERAASYYRQVEDGFAGQDPVILASAQDRLGMLAELREPIVFAPAPTPLESSDTTAGVSASGPQVEASMGGTSIPLQRVDPPESIKQEWAKRRQSVGETAPESGDQASDAQASEAEAEADDGVDESEDLPVSDPDEAIDASSADSSEDEGGAHSSDGR